MKILSVLLILFIGLFPANYEVDFKPPVDARHPVVSTFGEKTHPLLQTTRHHNGIDYALEAGTEVVASSSGTISFAGERGDHGNTIIIDHGNGFESQYSQLGNFSEDIREGTKVEQGVLIAWSGKSGLANMPHLHFAILKDGEFVDPLTYISD